MRMWCVNPKLMCRKHLLGEHVELHMLVGCIKKGKNIDGFVEKGLVDTSKIRDRHNEIAFEMLMRNMEHKSELPFFVAESRGSVDSEANIIELKRRCKDCRERIENE